MNTVVGVGEVVSDVVDERSFVFFAGVGFPAPELSMWFRVMRMLVLLRSSVYNHSPNRFIQPIDGQPKDYDRSCNGVLFEDTNRAI